MYSENVVNEGHAIYRKYNEHVDVLYKSRSNLPCHAKENGEWNEVYSPFVCLVLIGSKFLGSVHCIGCWIPIVAWY